MDHTNKPQAVVLLLWAVLALAKVSILYADFLLERGAA